MHEMGTAISSIGTVLSYTKKLSYSADDLKLESRA